jgi:hypothetical protein
MRQLSSRIVLEIYQKQGFEKIKDLIGKLSVKTLQGLVKFIPEAEPYLKMNQEQLRAVNKTKDYGGGGQFGRVPNL